STPLLYTVRNAHPRTPSLPSLFLLNPYHPHPDLHSFPTRRSSDLGTSSHGHTKDHIYWVDAQRLRPCPVWSSIIHLFQLDNAERSEEHTSELQSRENLVCRLLLEKKKLNI